jgi:ATP-dependent DNA ligase
MSWRPRTLPAGFVEPCLPTSSKRPPAGDGWLHEIKHDGFWCIARKEGKRVRLYSRPGNDLARRFTRIVEAVARLKARTCIIDGEAVACGPTGSRRSASSGIAGMTSECSCAPSTSSN